MDIPTGIIKRFNMGSMEELENEVSTRPDVIHSNDLSPVRFEIFARGMRMGRKRPPATPRTLPHMVASLRGIFRSLRDINKNPTRPKTEISPEGLSEMEHYAYSVGVGALGYTKLPQKLIFRGKGVLFNNAIVLVMEMDKDKIETAPAPKANETVMETYHYELIISSQFLSSQKSLTSRSLLSKFSFSSPSLI